MSCFDSTSGNFPFFPLTGISFRVVRQADNVEYASSSNPNGFSFGFSSLDPTHIDYSHQVSICIGVTVVAQAYIAYINNSAGNASYSHGITAAQVTAAGGGGGGGGTEDTGTMDGKERISFDSGRDGRRFRAYVGASDALKVEAPSTFNGASNSWTDRPTSRTGRFPCLRLSPATGALELAYITPASATVGAGALSRTRSVDNALTWSPDLQIAASGATYPAIVTARDGRRLFYWIAGGALYGQIVGGTGGVIEPTFTAIAGTGIKAVDVAERVDTGGVWRVEAAVRFADGSLVFYRSDPAGKVFAAV